MSTPTPLQRQGPRPSAFWSVATCRDQRQVGTTERCARQAAQEQALAGQCSRKFLPPCLWSMVYGRSVEASPAVSPVDYPLMKHVRPERPLRLDKLLVERGLAESRTKAQALVMAGLVLVNDQRANKPSDSVAPDAQIRVKGSDDPTSRYVGRGGLKLERALADFEIDVKGLDCLDVGASTGGFTDCLLQHGARHVIAVDVGHNQIDWRLRTDSRVEVRERVNARYLQADDFASKFDLVVMDVSFISATKIMPAIVPLLRPAGRLIVLIKPQFEVGRGEVGKGGIVRDPEQHARVIDEVNRAAQQLGLRSNKVIESPIQGADGNVEFLALYDQKAGARPPS